MKDVDSSSVNLIVTSPPYPMIEMWDNMFMRQNAKISEALKNGNGTLSFDLMHKELDPVWEECWRVLKEGGFACINIGDATRTINNNFSLYSNHSRIISKMLELGFNVLPVILWRKQTNAPNKFMGSGMMPAGAYVTLEHEYILIFRKGGKRVFKTNEEKINRRHSAFFWEERNNWFSDVWMDLKGASQVLFDNKTRKRNASFPFELPYRIINMYSAKGDTVLDPFLGLGTTSFAAIASARNSIGFEIEKEFKDQIVSKVKEIVSLSNDRIDKRLKDHIDFVEERVNLKHENKYYNFPVVTNQEKELLINELISVEEKGKNTFEANYSVEPQNRSTRMVQLKLLDL